jgi:hypothetical protein
MELEGYELTAKATELALEIRRKVNDHPLIAKYFHILTPAEMVPAEFRQSGLDDFGMPGSTWHALLDAMDEDEIALDPTRLTLFWAGRASTARAQDVLAGASISGSTRRRATGSVADHQQLRSDSASDQGIGDACAARRGSRRSGRGATNSARQGTGRMSRPSTSALSRRFATSERTSRPCAAVLPPAIRRKLRYVKLLAEMERRLDKAGARRRRFLVMLRRFPIMVRDK